MVELVRFIIREIADTGEVEITETDKGGIIEMDIIMPKAEIGKIIGKQGRIAKALRTVVKAAAGKQGLKYNINIKEV